MWQCSNKGISPFVVLGACLLCSLVLAAEDWATTQQLRNEERAAYWKERGYLFDASTLTAYQMDQQVRDIQRDQYWKTQGYDFDPRIMSAYQMDRAAAASRRSHNASSVSVHRRLDTELPQTLHPMSDFSSDPIPAIPPIAPGEKRDAEPPGRYLGNWSANPFAPNSTSNRFGAGNEFSPDSVRNEYGRYGSPYSNESANNPYATNAPRLYDSQGNYRGRLSSNPYDPESISNPYGRYGNRFSPDSVNNPFGAGNPFSADSPTNPFGQGLRIHGEK